MDSYSQTFSITQAEVAAFAALTGDANPLHLDAAYAATTAFKRPIVHGMLSAAVFSKILGMHYPGPGTIYLSQTLQFLRPMFVDIPYTATVTLVELDTAKRTMRLATIITDDTTKKITLKGEAMVQTG